MKTLRPTLVVLWLAGGLGLEAQTVLSRNFDADKPGGLPPGFVLAVFRAADPGQWVVRGQGSQHYVVHAGAPGARGYSVALVDGTLADYQVASVRLRLAGGGRAGGLVWRYRDPQNFYMAELNLVDRDMAVYRVQAGNRIRIEFEDDLELDVNAWHSLKVTHDGPEVSVSLGGIRVFEDTDRRNRTAPAGTVGLLASVDSEVWFDDLRVDRRR